VGLRARLIQGIADDHAVAAIQVLHVLLGWKIRRRLIAHGSGPDLRIWAFSVSAGIIEAYGNLYQQVRAVSDGLTPG